MKQEVTSSCLTNEEMKGLKPGEGLPVRKRAGRGSGARQAPCCPGPWAVAFSLPLPAFPLLPLWFLALHCVFIPELSLGFLDLFVAFFFTIILSPPPPLNWMTSRWWVRTQAWASAGSTQLGTTEQDTCLTLKLGLPSANSRSRTPWEVSPSKEPWRGVWCRARRMGSRLPPLSSTVKWYHLEFFFFSINVEISFPFNFSFSFLDGKLLKGGSLSFWMPEINKC